MKAFIVLAVFAATASASLIASPAVGYNAHGLGLGGAYGAHGLGAGGVYNAYGLGGGASLVSGVRTVGHVGGSYVSPIATRVVSPVSAGLLSPIGYGAQHASGYGQLQQVGLVSTPIVGHVRTVTPIVNAVHLSPVATRVVAPVSALNVHSAPIVANVVGSNLYASHGSGLYAHGHLAKKL